MSCALSRRDGARTWSQPGACAIGAQDHGTTGDSEISRRSGEEVDCQSRKQSLQEINIERTRYSEGSPRCGEELWGEEKFFGPDKILERASGSKIGFQVARAKRRPGVFLNIPYDDDFEDLYLAYVVGLTQLGFDVQVTIGVPNDDRLATIIKLIEQCDVSIHDLSRIEVSKRIPRFNMPLELGLALYRSHSCNGRHRVFVFEKKTYRAQKSTSDINKLDPRIHRGTVKGVMAGLRDCLIPENGTSVPEMLASYRAVKDRVPLLKRNAGSKSLFSPSAFNDLKIAALANFEALRKGKTK